MDTRPESATPTFDNLKPSELVVTESLYDDKPLGKKKKSSIDECDAPKKRLRRDEAVLETSKIEIPDGKIHNNYSIIKTKKVFLLRLSQLLFNFKLLLQMLSRRPQIKARPVQSR